MKKEISQPLVIGALVAVVILVGVFGWFQLKTPTPNVTAAETKKAGDRQMQDMLDAMNQLKSQSRPVNR